MWNKEAQCLQRPLPKVLIEELPILRIIPIEAHRLKLQVRLLRIPYRASFDNNVDGCTTLRNLMGKH